MILIAYRHGLRASEVTSLRVSDVDLKRGTIYCRRAKNSRSSLHPLKPDEAAALERVLRQRKSRTNEYMFQSERAEKLTRSAFWRVVTQTGERAGLAVKAYAHQLRHAVGVVTHVCGRIIGRHVGSAKTCQQNHQQTHARRARPDRQMHVSSKA